jgi:RNA polymerase sigma-70 factor (ECF subfamily)
MASTPQDAFAECFVHCQHRVFGYIVSLLPSRDDADEVFQQTSLILWRKWDEFDSQRDFVSWACGIAHFEALAFLRRADRKAISLSNETLELVAQTKIAGADLDVDRDAALRKCLEGLPDKQRSLIDECYGQEVKHRVVAERMGISPANLYMRLHRVRQLLLRCIERRLAMEHPG